MKGTDRRFRHIFDTRLPHKQWYFCFFLVSGFCSILYEIIWMRLAMAQFGVTTAIISIFLSAFMAGLGVGSWASGFIVRRFGATTSFSALKLYALTELLIGASALAVPHQLIWGREMLRQILQASSPSTPLYYLAAGSWFVLALIPWSACMGATFPFVMGAIKEDSDPEANKSFSYLYLANIIGATAGTIIPLGLIELFGFRHTLRVGAVLNLSLAAAAFALSVTRSINPSRAMQGEISHPVTVQNGQLSNQTLLCLLLGTGLTSMGSEVVWVRLYTPFLSTTVYSFAAILGIYLLATYLGTRAYRLKNNSQVLESGPVWLVLGASVMLAFLTTDLRIPLPDFFRVPLGIMPFSGLAGFLTPAMIDRFSGGDAARAGKAYAVNVIGCILGPLVAGFLLLPIVGERLTLFVLALPWFAVSLKYRPKVSLARNAAGSLRLFGYAALALGIVFLTFLAKGFEERFPNREVRRDSTATVIAMGSERHKALLVNGVGMTFLSPITKPMVHLPMAFLPRQPRNTLVFCFGMGTTQLSMLSWGVHSTAVELVPSVPSLITFFHPNAATAMASPLSSVVIDDGRSYLERSPEQYDVITLDPPPPVSAAGSSLLYSKEFYDVAKRHLRAGGILQQWLPEAEPAVVASVARSLTESFPYVRAFHGIDDQAVQGVQFLVSMSPIPNLSAVELAAKLPEPAVRDFLEWGPASDAQQQFELVLSREVSVGALLQAVPGVPALADDRPFNEYFVLRRYGRGMLQAAVLLNAIGLSLFLALRLGFRLLTRIPQPDINEVL